MFTVVDVIITIENLTFYYDSIPALKNVSIKIESNKLVTILGPNGSGKTTFLKCLCRLLKPKVGVIYIDNQCIWDVDLKVFTQQVGYVPQIHYPALPYRVIDVVVSGRTPYLELLGIPSKKDYELALQALKLVGCEHLAERPYTQLSGGELRLVLIARALAQQPKVLLLDEPTSNLDFRNKITVMSILKNLARRGLLIITTEHDPNIVTMFSDEVILMKNGFIVAHGKPYEVINEENMKLLYDIDVEVLTLNNYRDNDLKLVIPKIIS
jgi:iron complex transport system ATP-binding protein